ncbi:thioesterase family protein [Tianweitania sediminis]|uniref:Thioesterase family protein n=1 Tax=Tianweitania sediminis TaxID=1502156 RepID=A0A8J7R2G2_9HYPH|nr:thioesterase family protein [Tianweitania sediminis]MBP0439171.1 thioesterase family protein [Tianweitania sediminis]
MSTPAPFTSTPLDIEKEWIDYNGHLNMAFYNVLFDRGVDQAYDILGIGADYAKTRRLTTYTAEVHVCYVRELHLGDRVTVSFQILDTDEKRIHVFQEIHHVDGWLAATSEGVTLHVDMAGPKVTPFPPDILEKIEAMKQAHASLPRPERAGRSIGIKRKS